VDGKWGICVNWLSEHCNSFNVDGKLGSCVSRLL
jgi:hypothetical protein